VEVQRDRKTEKKTDAVPAAAQHASTLLEKFSQPEKGGQRIVFLPQKQTTDS